MTAAAVGAAGRRRPGAVRRARRRALAVGRGAALPGGLAARLGFVADLLSATVLVGYMAGVAVIMIVGQLGKLTGVPVDGDTFGAELRVLPSRPGAISSGATLARRRPCSPSCFSSSGCSRPPGAAARGAAGHAAVSRAFDLRASTASTWSARSPPGCPRRRCPTSATCGTAAAGGRRAPGRLHRHGADRPGVRDPAATHEIDANQELLALGAANLGAGLLRGFPVSSSGSRTALGDRRGRPHPGVLAGGAGGVVGGAAVRSGRCWPTSRPRRSARSSSTPRSA